MSENATVLQMEAVSCSETSKSTYPAAWCHNRQHHSVPAAAMCEFQLVTHTKTCNEPADLVITALVPMIKRMFNCIRGVECGSPQNLRVGC